MSFLAEKRCVGHNKKGEELLFYEKIYGIQQKRGLI